MMPVYAFELIIDAPPEAWDSDMPERIYAACPDSCLAMFKGVITAGFDREAPTSKVAVESALEDLARLGYGARFGEWMDWSAPHE